MASTMFRSIGVLLSVLDVAKGEKCDRTAQDEQHGDTQTHRDRQQHGGSEHARRGFEERNRTAIAQAARESQRTVAGPHDGDANTFMLASDRSKSGAQLFIRNASALAIHDDDEVAALLAEIIGRQLQICAKGSFTRSRERRQTRNDFR